MKRIFKSDERIWFEDDHMNGWGKVALINGSDDHPEVPVDIDDIITVTKDSGGEIETTADRIYQLAPYTFQGDQCCWEHNETEDDYPLFCPERYENCFFFECEHVEWKLHTASIIEITEAGDVFTQTIADKDPEHLADLVIDAINAERREQEIDIKVDRDVILDEILEDNQSSGSGELPMEVVGHPNHIFYISTKIVEF